MAVTLQDQQVNNIAYFRSLFESYEERLNGHRNDRVHAFRRKAIEELETLSFPNRRDEDWKYTPVTRMLQPDYKEGKAVSLSQSDVARFSIEGLDARQLVFINGLFSEEHSNLAELPEGVVIKPLAEALADERFGGLIQEKMNTKSENRSEAFLALNAAFARNGVFIYIPANTAVDRMIHLNYISANGEEPIFCHPQLMVVTERSSELRLLETYNSLSDDQVYLTNAVSNIIVGENATVHHYKLQNESAAAYQVNNTRVEQARSSVYSSYALDLGGKMVRNNLSSRLTSEGTNTNLYGVYLGTGRQHIDNQTFIDHAFPHCESNELYKGVLTDNARGVFNGKVIVRQDAQKTNAFQQNSNLVLSPGAVMDTKPQLEIFADDVRCSHGATIGQLDETAVFYLRSRGLNDEQARQLLKHAFLKEVIDHFPSEPISQAFEELIVRKFG